MPIIHSWLTFANKYHRFKVCGLPHHMGWSSDCLSLWGLDSWSLYHDIHLGIPTLILDLLCNELGLCTLMVGPWLDMRSFGCGFETLIRDSWCMSAMLDGFCTWDSSKSINGNFHSLSIRSYQIHHTSWFRTSQKTLHSSFYLVRSQRSCWYYSLIRLYYCSSRFGGSY